MTDTSPDEFTLSAAVRKRPGMYVGDTSEFGLHQLVEHLLEGAVSRFLLRCTSRISVTIGDPQSALVVEDDGRWLDQSADPEPRILGESLAKALTQYRECEDVRGYDGWQFARTLFIPIALSREFQATLWADERMHSLRWERGRQTGSTQTVASEQKSGNRFSLQPDPAVFSTTTFSSDRVRDRCREFAFLNAGLEISFEDRRGGECHSFRYPDGIAGRVRELTGCSADEVIRRRVDFNGGEMVEIAYGPHRTPIDGAEIVGYVNQLRSESGTHMSGFKDGLLAIAEADSGRLAATRDSVVALVSVLSQLPVFGSTRQTLDNPEMRTRVAEVVIDAVREHRSSKSCR